MAVVGAGVVGATVAYALAREGRSVVLFDRAEPGHGERRATAMRVILPRSSCSRCPRPSLLCGFWRELVCFDGGARPAGAAGAAHAALDPALRSSGIPAPREHPAAGAAGAPAAAAWARRLAHAGRPELLRRHGHYEIGFGARARRRMRGKRAMAQLGIDTQPVPAEQLAALQRAAHAERAAGLWFPNSAHVVDPLEAGRALAAAAAGARARRSGTVRGALACAPAGGDH